MTNQPCALLFWAAARRPVPYAINVPLPQSLFMFRVVNEVQECIHFLL